MKFIFSVCLCVSLLVMHVDASARPARFDDWTEVNNKPLKREPLVLITGCGRSGTTYTTLLLKKSGLDIGHEKMGKDGIVSWLMAVPSDQTPFGPGLKGRTFQHIFHQVRHPLDVITSWYSNEMKPQSWGFIYRHIPEIHFTEPLLVRCAKYWYYWNLEAEKVAEWRYRVEDIPELLEEIGNRLGIYIEPSVLEEVPNDSNTRNPINDKVTWDDLQQVLSEEDYKNIRALALKYGYS